MIAHPVTFLWIVRTSAAAGQSTAGFLSRAGPAAAGRASMALSSSGWSHVRGATLPWLAIKAGLQPASTSWLLPVALTRMNGPLPRERDEHSREGAGMTGSFHDLRRS